MIPVFGQIGPAAGRARRRRGRGADHHQQIGIALGAAGFGAVLIATPAGPAHSSGWAALTVGVFAGMAILAVITGSRRRRDEVRNVA